jgi:dolichol-phosphate mannosyltransferase
MTDRNHRSKGRVYILNTWLVNSIPKVRCIELFAQASNTTNQNIEERLGSLSSIEDPSASLEGNIDTRSDIGVILPTYCEAANIAQLIEEIEGLRQNISILVIDDSSPDGTASIVRGLQKKYDNVLLLARPEKYGLGTAITDGFRIFLSLNHAPKCVITMDADYSHNPKDIMRLVSALKGKSDLVIGSRYCSQGKTKDWSLVRYTISRVANTTASLLIRAKIRDYTSGMRCYSANLVKSILGDLHSTTYEIQIETIRQAHLRKFRISEVPIVFMNRKRGKSKLAFNEIKQFISYVLIKL